MDSEISFQRWRQDHAVQLGPVIVNWRADDYRDLTYWEKHSIGEIPKDDIWDSRASREKLNQERMYKAWGYEQVCTQHWQIFEEEIPGIFIDKAQELRHVITDTTVSLLKIMPGRQLPWHMDTFAFYLKTRPHLELDDCQRVLVFLEDFQQGHIVQIGSQLISGWRAGDAITWKSDIWHGACNFGVTPFYTLQYTGTSSR